MFVFQYAQKKADPQQKPSFDEKKTYTIDFNQSFGVGEVPNVDWRASRYMEVFLKGKGIEINKDLTAKVKGSVLNEMCKQTTINSVTDVHNRGAEADFEKLPLLSSREVVKMTNALLVESKYESIKDSVPKKN